MVCVQQKENLAFIRPSSKKGLSSTAAKKSTGSPCWHHTHNHTTAYYYYFFVSQMCSPPFFCICNYIDNIISFLISFCLCALFKTKWTITASSSSLGLGQQPIRHCFHHPGASLGNEHPATTDGPEITQVEMMKGMMSYIWPKDNSLIRRRVCLSVALLVGAKTLNVGVPFIFKSGRIFILFFFSYSIVYYNT